MTRRTIHLLLVVFVLLCIAVAGFWSVPGPKDDPPETAPALTVRPIHATPLRWPDTLQAAGSIGAWQEVVIASELGGLRLAQLPVDIGDRVGKGQLLARIDGAMLAAELEASRAALREAEINAARTRLAAERARALQGTEALAQQAIDDAAAAAEVAQARLEAARAQVQAKALRLAQTEIRAPADGVVSARAAVEGMTVSAGMELLRLQRQGRLEWRAELPGPDLARVSPGMVARLTLGDGRSLEGKVRQVAPQVDPQSRTGIVHVDLPADSGARAGLFARGAFLLGERMVLTLPESAVVLRDGHSYAFRIEGERVRQLQVQTGARHDGRVEIRSGLDAETPVVESGAGFLADGARVRVQMASQRVLTPAGH